MRMRLSPYWRSRRTASVGLRQLDPEMLQDAPHHKVDDILEPLGAVVDRVTRAGSWRPRA